MVSKCVENEGLTLFYVTKRLIVLSSSEEGDSRSYAEALRKAAAALKAKHFEHYKVWTVSRRRADVRRLLLAEDSGWPKGLAPPLDKLCAVCKQLEQWLTVHPENVAVIHCRGDRSRAAMIVSAHMHYNAICANDDPVEDRFSMQRYADRYIGGSGQPSHRRYISYFSSLLSGRVRVNPTPFFLLRLAVSHFGGRILVFKIYERMAPVYESIPIHSKDVSRLEIEGELRLRGDVLVKCFQLIGDHRKELFLCQLNTCSLELAGRTAALTFHKEELDHVFNDPSVDNRVVLELLVSLDPPKTGKRSSGLTQLETRSNSYESFLLDEDETSANGQAVVYSEIKKDSSKKKKRKEEEIKREKEEDERRAEELATMPPPVPPKPRSASAMAEPIQDMPERRGVLPAQVRPVAHRPPSPRTAAGRATPSIEPDLVGKDRYDKASKCFSYAPKKELSEAFERPRRPSFSRSEPRAEEQVSYVDPAEAARVQIMPQHALKPVEAKEKWDDEVERTKQEALLEQLSRMPVRSHSVAGQPYYSSRRSADEDEIEEKPLIVDQAQKATTTPTSTLRRNNTNYGSYKTLHDEKYSTAGLSKKVAPMEISAMDDLCDPDFYLNYKAPAAAPVPPPRHAGAKSVELPRRRFQPVEAFTDPLDEILNSSVAGSCQDVSHSRDAFRDRNCRSVAALPSRDRKLFAHNYEATEEAKNPDDWLTNQLRKVRSKRNLDPDIVRRRTQEKMLLEELKNVNDEREATKNEYVVDGYGSQHQHPADPLTEFRREEERLKNTHSPYQDMQRRGGRGVRSKPPTPPPRERSRSPTRSEVATPSIDGKDYPKDTYQRGEYGKEYKHMNGGGGRHHLDEDFDFSTLNSIVEPSTRGSRSLQRKASFGNERPPFQYADQTLSQRPETPTRFFSGQERVAAAIFRAETPQRELYSSQTIHRPETPSRYFPENTTYAQRSATPSFPRETPIPFHPLLYSQNGASRADLDKAAPHATLNYRSSSPRSQYGQLSRRSSLTSVDTSEIIHHHPVFVKDTSKYWYKPSISREAAINMLRDKAPGTFVVRDSNSFPGAFGLALKVAQPPPGVAPGDGTELVRHFLIEPSPKGVKLKGCNNEPVFGSLSALVYQHSITPLALPTKLLLPEYDPASTPEHVSATQALLEQGAACNVTYIGSVDVESLTGTECVRRAIGQAVDDVHRGMMRPVSVHFKVSSQGITLTDNTRKVFFRRHFAVNTVIFAGMDPSDRRFENIVVLGFSDGCVHSARMFAFVARKPSSMENSCHVFAELEPEQPGSAVINFINKVMLSNRR